VGQKNLKIGLWVNYILAASRNAAGKEVESWWIESADQKKFTTQVRLFDVLGSGWLHIVSTVPVLSIFCISIGYSKGWGAKTDVTYRDKVAWLWRTTRVARKYLKRGGIILVASWGVAEPRDSFSKYSAALFYGVARSDFDARQSYVSKMRDKISGVTSVLQLGIQGVAKKMKNPDIPYWNDDVRQGLEVWTNLVHFSFFIHYKICINKKSAELW